MMIERGSDCKCVNPGRMRPAKLVKRAKQHMEAMPERALLVRDPTSVAQRTAARQAALVTIMVSSVILIPLIVVVIPLISLIPLAADETVAIP